MAFNTLVFSVTFLSLAIWIYLLGFRGQFWRCDQRLDSQTAELETWPTISVVIPARNEADLLPKTLRSLLTQNYPGILNIILVDDHSSDGTAKVANQVGQELGKTQLLHILSAKPLPPNWTGKLWALQQGTDYAQTLTPPPDYCLLTDADIQHDPDNLRQLVTKAEQDNLDLVSLMVKLRCESFWEKFLIPAFIFFFEKLYPFPWVNNPTKPMAAAAGGCILLKSEALNRIGGIAIVKNALIDDCALAAAVKLGKLPKSPGKNPISDQFPLKKDISPIWLGLSEKTISLRPYSSLATIWQMVARTAYTQLNYSPLLLAGTVVAMMIIYLIPPIAIIFGSLSENGQIAIVGLITWLLMAVAYFPTVRLYQRSPLWALSLPAIAFLYTLMTLDSALRHWQKRGGNWKGRVYSNE
ncbi:MAG: glycosyltransferase [Chroococcales cyanobacterium]